MNYNDTSVDTGKQLYHASSLGPFHCSNNIYMFYGGADRSRIVECVIRAIRADEPPVHVHGERGSGKTMMSLVISDRLKNRYNVIRYDVAEVSVALLLRHLLIELCPKQADLVSPQQALAGTCVESEQACVAALINQLSKPGSRRTRKPYVLLLDSNEQLDANTLHVIEQLTTVRVAGQAIFHCVIFQQVEADDPKALRFTQTSAWSANHFWLQRLTLAEINEYLRHQMVLFDFSRRDLFTREMTYFIADRSEGVFRAINKLVRDAFTIAKFESAEKVSMSHLLMAGLPQRSESPHKSGFLIRYRAGVVALIGLCVVASSAAVVFLML